MEKIIPAKLSTLKDVSERLNISRSKITYLFVSGKLEEPMHLAGHRIFDEDKILEISDYFFNKGES